MSSVGFELNETRARTPLLETCLELQKAFAKRAPDFDRTGRFPVENFEDLKRAGLTGIMVPVEKGGLGSNFVTYTQALETLAKGDPATALCFNMHNITIGSLAEVAASDQSDRRSTSVRAFRDWAFEQAVVEKKVFASASSEPGVGAHFSQFKTTYHRTPDGYVLNGVKSFVSMAGYADYYVVAARAGDSKSKQAAISFFVVDANAPGITWENTWDTLGMRSTSTNPVRFQDCVIPKDRLYLASEGLALYKIAREPHWLVGGYNGVYLGIIQAAFDFLIEFLGKKPMRGSETKVSEDPLVQHEIGRLHAALRSARLATYHAARLVDMARGTPEANAAIHHAKYVVSELGPWFTSNAIRLCGATGLSKRLPLERYYRDARCGGLMPATSDECLTYLGKAAFGANLNSPLETYW